MSLPHHNNPTAEKDTALAPYNFVPLPEKVVILQPEELPDQGVYHPDHHTGHIDCVLITESPLYVRCPFTPEEFDKQQQQEQDGKKRDFRDQIKNKSDFFYTDPDKTPRIPGSSLRGMLRTLVEIVSYSKIEYVTHQQLVYRSVGDTTSHGKKYRNRLMRDDGLGYERRKQYYKYTPLMQAGYIKEKNGDWYIQPAQEIGGTTFARLRIDHIPKGLPLVDGCKNAFDIYIQPGPYDYQKVRGGFIRVKYSKVWRVSGKAGRDLIKGTLAYSGPMVSKRTEAVVFGPNEDADLIPISDDLVRAYREQVSKEQEDILGDSNGVLREGQPIFYLMEEDKKRKKQLVFFGHTMMMRLPYHKSPLDFIPEMLRRPTDLDMAEAIFGYTKETGEGKARAYAGRVFIGDAVLGANQGDVWLKPEEPIIPRILAGAKPTTFQHYLVQKTPDPKQVGRTRDGRPKFAKELADYASDGTVLRGHKLYWHKGQVTLDNIAETIEKLREISKKGKPDTQHTHFRPVKNGVLFRFRIQFENLSSEELGALLWVLSLPGKSKQKYRHFIGMGKPLGMGAIRVQPTLYLSDRQARYSSLFDEKSDDGWNMATEAANEEQMQDLIKKFDDFIRKEIEAEGKSSLAEVERIAMLLKMLQWPGPDKELTRYLEIERQHPRAKRGKLNEYKTRPVLPDPLHVEEPIDGEEPPPAINTTKKAKKSAPKAKLELSYPTSADEIQAGMYLEGRVTRVESSRVVVDIGVGGEATLQKPHIVPKIRDVYDLKERFPIDKKIRVWVKGRNKRGRIQLTMKMKR
ncbi:MAG: TIGR03986 family type III CRISPR-associated RAMP protein [Ardenticatenaceae bacterium]